MAGSCSYDCSLPGSPSAGTPDSDITGIGVIANYIATAGLSILVIAIYYCVVYDPSKDSFNIAREETIHSQSNPVDGFILGGIRSSARYVSRRLLGIEQMGTRANVRIQVMLVKCVLVMSDLQTVTGFAILVSGYTQLECGLTWTEWRAILDLAWFAYVTQLSCLAILQDHFYTHTFERFWRLLATGILATLLAVGLLLTATPGWYEQNGSRPAICKLGYYKGDKDMDEYTLRAINTTIVSAAFVVAAFISRVVRLHEFLSVGILRRSISWLDFWMRQLLWILFKWTCTGQSIYSLKRSLIYRPLLAVYVTLHLLLVSWASFAVEICWVCVAFAWGVFRLYLDLGGQSGFFTTSRENWTFGQVVSVIMLTAPLVSFFGAFNDDDSMKNKEDSMARDVPNAPTFPILSGRHNSQYPSSTMEAQAKEDPENPDTDWSLNTSFLGAVISYCFAVCLAMACLIFPKSRSYSSVSVSPFEGIYAVGSTAIPLAFWGLYCLVLCSILIELATPQDMPWLRRLLLGLIIGLLLVAWTLFANNFSLATQPTQSMAVVGVYFIGVLIYRGILWAKMLFFNTYESTSRPETV